MAAPNASSNRPHRQEVEFPPNVPVTVALKFAQAKTVSGFNGERFMFSTTDNRVMFLDPEVGGQIEQLGVNVREPFTITMLSDGKKGSPVTWRVARIAAAPAVGEQPDGTFAVPKLPETAAAPKPPQRATAASPGLADEAIALVDTYALVLAHALTKHEGRVKPDEVRALLITSYIARNKLSSVA